MLYLHANQLSSIVGGQLGGLASLQGLQLSANQTLHRIGRFDTVSVPCRTDPQLQSTYINHGGRLERVDLLTKFDVSSNRIEILETGGSAERDR